MKDRFAMLRNKDPLTLIEAAHLVAEVPPGSTWPSRGMTTEQRSERDTLDYFKRELIAAATHGALVADLQYDTRPAERGTDPFTREPIYREGYRGLNAAASTVRRADLERWCKDQGVPAILQPAEFSDGDIPPYLSDRLATLRFAWRKHWERAEPDQKDTWPNPGAVEATLRAKGPPLDSRRMSEALASFIRPSWAPPGRRPKN
ncbi:MAG: hypothetical protein KDI56_17860 [Xanthomonadales bacterium]|nr:hypothetical protein [Xanthomonadales bacterium]